MSDVLRFLQALDPTAAAFLFQTFDDSHNKNYHLTNTVYGTFIECESILREYNKAGAGVFIAVNKTKGNRRRTEDFIQARAIWQEDDNKTEAISLPDLSPQVVIESSPAHYHRYWLTSLGIDSHEDLIRWGKLQFQMVRKYGSDPGAKDMARVLRVPTFINHKYDKPFTVRLVSIGDTARYSIEQLETSLGIGSAPKEDTNGAERGADTDTDTSQESNAPHDQLAEYLRQIVTGEHLHTPLRAIMIINANKGHDIAYNRLQCTAFIQMCPDDSRRRKATADLESMLTATYRKVDAEAAADETVTPEEFIPRKDTLPTIDLDWPPGPMGELAIAANNFFVVPNKTVAIMTALSLIAGITGRRYNVSTSGLNLYTTIMMPTGAGKDSIRKFAQRVLMDKHMLGTNGLSFLGPQNFTGPKALRQRLQANPSMLCVMTEAGLLYKTDSGDKTGLTRVILQAYTSSGQYEILEEEEYSSQNDSLTLLRSPALTILNEATPITLLGELKKRESINTGELPRMWIFMLDGKKPFNNPDPHQLNLPRGVLDRTKYLLNDCYTVQSNDAPEVIDIPVPDAFHEYSRHCTTQYNNLINENPNKAIMYTRAAHKVLKTAALLAVFNCPDTLKLSERGITTQEWNWATHLYDYEMANIEPIISPHTSVDQALLSAMDVIVKLLKNEYGSRNMRVALDLREKGIFTESTFKQAANSRPAIRDCEVSSKYGTPKSGIYVIIGYMLQEGYIRSITNLPKGKGSARRKLFQITPLFKDKWELFQAGIYATNGTDIEKLSST